MIHLLRRTPAIVYFYFSIYTCLEPEVLCCPLSLPQKGVVANVCPGWNTGDTDSQELSPSFPHNNTFWWRKSPNDCNVFISLFPVISFLHNFM